MQYFSKLGVILIPMLLLCTANNKNEAGAMKTIKSIDLPEPHYTSEISIEEALKNRRSHRSYQDTALELADLAQILWAAYGITKKIDSGPSYLRGGLRTAPSAGALYPLEIYLVVGQVDELEPGIYKYNSRKHELDMLISGDKRRELGQAALGQTHVRKAAASLVYAAVYERTTRKYGERGRERYVCMDLGHSAENVYLQAYSLQIGTCAVGAFSDQKVASLMPFQPEEKPLYIMPLGYVK